MIGLLDCLGEILHLVLQPLELGSSFGLGPDGLPLPLLGHGSAAVVVLEDLALGTALQVQTGEHHVPALELGHAPNRSGQQDRLAPNLDPGRGVGNRDLRAQLLELCDCGVVCLENFLELERGLTVITPGTHLTQANLHGRDHALKALAPLESPGDGEGVAGHG